MPSTIEGHPSEKSILGLHPKSTSTSIFLRNGFQFMKLSGISTILFLICTTTLFAQEIHPVQVTYVVDGDTFWGI
ncbi:MAG: hypothetical protein P8M34_03225, partial [Saprospiraceae bacterium]|nr:hypothetical protein [Saprospiraceae bacterium]